MDIKRIDLNLLIYLDALLKERSVSRAADKLGITQPAMSNALKRLRTLLNDPLLVRSSKGMMATERAETLEPVIRDIINRAEMALQNPEEFNPAESRITFRLMASDYIEATLIAPLLGRMTELAPGISLDVLTPSDASFEDLEKGNIHLAINRFDYLPDSFHQKSVWRDNFSCLLAAEHPAASKLDLPTYLTSEHIWVSKTGVGVGTGMSSKASQKLGWVDEALADIGHERNIAMFTRHYQVASAVVLRSNLVATLPTRAALMWRDDPHFVLSKPPFPIVPIEIKMAWSPVLHHNASHQWFRNLIIAVAQTVSGY